MQHDLKITPLFELRKLRERRALADVARARSAARESATELDTAEKQLRVSRARAERDLRGFIEGGEPTQSHKMLFPKLAVTRLRGERRIAENRENVMERQKLVENARANTEICEAEFRRLAQDVARLEDVVGQIEDDMTTMSDLSLEEEMSDIFNMIETRKSGHA